MAKNYYAVVHKETGKLLLNSFALPFYWNKKVAEREAKAWSNYIVQPVDKKELEKLVLSKPNKKAK